MPLASKWSSNSECTSYASCASCTDHVLPAPPTVSLTDCTGENAHPQALALYPGQGDISAPEISTDKVLADSMRATAAKFVVSK